MAWVVRHGKTGLYWKEAADAYVGSLDDPDKWTPNLAEARRYSETVGRDYRRGYEVGHMPYYGIDEFHALVQEGMKRHKEKG